MRTIFLGDSLTAGIPGVSYWRFLHKKSKLINKGLGGDTLLGAIDRAEKMLSNPRYNDVERYIIEIGTNDVLLPVMQQQSIVLEMFVKIMGRAQGSVPCKDIAEFNVKYEELLQKLIKHNKTIGVIGLPMIEDSTLMLNETMMEYDAVVVELCNKYSIPYLDFRQLEKKIKGNNCGSYCVSKTRPRNVFNTVFTTILPFSMQISKLRGLAITVDGTHLNRNMAKVLAAAIEMKLL